MSDAASKLPHLLPHWIEHNEAHLGTYRQWAEQAGAAGLPGVAEALKDAIRAVEEANIALQRAERSLSGDKP